MESAERDEETNTMKLHVAMRKLREDPMLVFNIAINLLIMANALVMGIETDHDLGVGGKVLENLFTATWSIEIIVRNITMTPKVYFTDRWCWMDFSLAWLSILGTWILPAAGGQKNNSLRLLSVLRILRLLRLLRLMKFLKVFRGLLLLVYGLIKALSVLSWVAVLLLIVLYVAALVMTNQIGHECDTTFADFSDCREMFSTIPESMYTMFQVITLESWSMAVARPVLRENPAFVILFIFFLYITTFGLLNVVMGVIVDQTLQTSSEDEVSQRKLAMKAQKAQALRLRHLFTNADVDDSGTITLKEFMDTCKSQNVVDDFRNINLQVTPSDAAKRLYEVLNFDGCDELQINDLLRRTQDLLGDGTSVVENPCFLLIQIRQVLNMVQHNTRKIKSVDTLDVDDIIQAIDNMESSVENQVAQFEDAFHSHLLCIEGDPRLSSL